MGKLTDVAIRAWIKAGARFEGRTDGDGLLLSWRPDRTAPHWRLRYRFAGKSRVMNLGSYTDLPLAAARQSAKELRAKIALGHDVAGEKQQRKNRFEFCGGFWNWLAAAHAAGLVFSVDKVRSELVAGRKGDPARTWAEQQPVGFFLPDAADAAAMRNYGTLMQWASNGGHYTPAAISEFAASKNADPFIVAVAKVHKCTVVTQEKADANAKRRVPLPNAAAVLGVNTLSIFDLLSKHAASTFLFKP